MNNAYKWVAGFLASALIGGSGAYFGMNNKVITLEASYTVEIKSITARLDRIENKLDRLLEQKAAPATIKVEK